ncbi:LuxR C-terminal-related transcriptional regulator, partial [Nonomuraea sp. NPDC055795]
KLLARGLSNAEIAQALNLTQTGVKGRVNRLLGRLGLANRVQAAILAQEHGLIQRGASAGPSSRTKGTQ